MFLILKMNAGLEIWNVFMQYNKDENGNFTPLVVKMQIQVWVQRVADLFQKGVDDNYLSSVWIKVIKKLESITGLKYEENAKSMRIIADHIRTSVLQQQMMLKLDLLIQIRGYILRRLIRRAIRYAKGLNIDIDSNWEQDLFGIIIDLYSSIIVNQIVIKMKFQKFLKMKKINLIELQKKV